MGTNYYAVKNRPTVEEPIHIGKSSIGWLFHFQTHNESWREPPVVWNTFNQLKEWLNKYTVESDDYVIIDEYDEIITLDEFLKLVDRKQNDEYCLSNSDNFSNARNVDGYRFSDVNFS